jgi:hypothetical protein
VDFVPKFSSSDPRPSSSLQRVCVVSVYTKKVFTDKGAQNYMGLWGRGRSTSKRRLKKKEVLS